MSEITTDDTWTPFGELLRDLAVAAMNVNHHDLDDSEPEWRYEVEEMERAFRPILGSYFAGMRKQR